MSTSRLSSFRIVLTSSIALAVLAISGCEYVPHRELTVFERAQSVRLEIRAGHFSEAEQQASKTLTQSRIGRWHFSPFATFVNYVSAPSDEEFAKSLNAWVGENSKSPFARLVRANYHYNQGWWVRGHGFSNEIDAARFDRFQHELALAAKDSDDVVQLAPNNPYARYLELLIARDTQSNAAQKAAFQKSIAKFPNYYPLYLLRLDALQPKWGGSTDAMKAFVKQYADAAPSGSPLKMLGLNLYVDLLGAASQKCIGQQGGDDLRECVERAMAQSADDSVTQSARAAIQTFAKRNDSEAVVEVEAALRSMAMTPGGGTYAIKFLLAAADSLHSDPQLVTGNAGNNVYAVDRIASLIWYRQGNYANALTLANRAKKDLANTRFTSEAEGRDAKAEINRDFLETYARLQNYPQVAAYGEAMAQLSGGFGANPGFDRLTCEALFRLQRYSQALKTCSAIINASEDLQARFFRARVYDATKRGSEAIGDYQVVADSAASADFITYSALAISIIYGNENKDLNALSSLNGFENLFAASHVTNADRAVYYNNRCYYKMKLEHPKAALDDCNISLRYGNIPDAVSKQQQLMHQLGKPDASNLSQGDATHGKSSH